MARIKNGVLTYRCFPTEVVSRFETKEEALKYLAGMKIYTITYHRHPEADITLTGRFASYEEAVIYAKSYRHDSFSIEEEQEVRV